MWLDTVVRPDTNWPNLVVSAGSVSKLQRVRYTHRVLDHHLTAGRGWQCLPVSSGSYEYIFLSPRYPSKPRKYRSCSNTSLFPWPGIHSHSVYLYKIGLVRTVYYNSENKIYSQDFLSLWNPIRGFIWGCGQHSKHQGLSWSCWDGSCNTNTIRELTVSHR